MADVPDELTRQDKVAVKRFLREMADEEAQQYSFGATVGGVDDGGE